jgi:hypothetical protein
VTTVVSARGRVGESRRTGREGGRTVSVKSGSLLFTVLALETSFFSEASDGSYTDDTLEEIRGRVEGSLDLIDQTVTERLSRNV